MAELKFITLVLVFTAITCGSVSAAASPNCGDTIAQVIEIVKRKYPDQDHAWLNNFLGDWLSDGEKVRLTPHEKFKVKGYAVTFCPYNGNRFQVRFKAGGSLAGIARMLGRNRIEIAQTMVGTIFLDRERSVQIRN